MFDGDLKTFVREVLQNSHDQKQRDSDHAEVVFEFYELHGEVLEAFLVALGWEELREHLNGVAEQNVLTSRSTAQTIEAIDRRDPLRLLKVSDFGTNGLVGSENEAGTNYKALVKDILETTEGGSKKGGSHGLGKAVLWAFSSISTVMFSSRLEDAGTDRLRFVGRADLPFHRTEDSPEGWDGAGWYGAEDPEEEPVRAVSIWGDAAAAYLPHLLLDRPDWLGRGTSILIPAFYEPRMEEQRTLDALAQAVVVAAVENFWPAIHRGTLRVRATVHEQDGMTNDLFAAGDLQRVGPYLETVGNSEVNETAVNDGEVAAREIEVRFPAPLDDPSGRTSITAQARLALRRSSEVDDETNSNRVALVRGAGMVVEYWRPKRQPLSGGGFHAVLQVGGARGTHPTDDDLEAFLRASEPPAHNKWDAGTNRIRNEYHRGSLKAINSLWEAISSAIVDMCETPPPPDQDGPDRLKKLLPMGAGAAIPKQSFRVTYENGHFEGTYWTLAARIQRLKGQGEWGTDVTALLDGESGRGVLMEVVDGEVSRGSAATAEVVDGKFHVTVHGANDVSFTIKAQGGDLKPNLLKRSRARLHAHSFSIEEQT